MTDTPGKLLSARLEQIKQDIEAGDLTREEARMLWEKAITNTLLQCDTDTILEEDGSTLTLREAVAGLRSLFEHTMRFAPRSGNQKLYYLH